MDVLFKNAWSLENKDNNSSVEPAGSTRKGNVIYDFFRDALGNYWYSTRFVTEQGVITEEEKVFGRKLRQRKRK